MVTRNIHRTSRQQPVINLVVVVAITRRKVAVSRLVAKVRNKNTTDLNSGQVADVLPAFHFAVWRLFDKIVFIRIIRQTLLLKVLFL